MSKTIENYIMDLFSTGVSEEKVPEILLYYQAWAGKTVTLPEPTCRHTMLIKKILDSSYVLPFEVTEESCTGDRYLWDLINGTNTMLQNTPKSDMEKYFHLLIGGLVESLPDPNSSSLSYWMNELVKSFFIEFTETGNPVTCNPVENYPLDVSLSFTPTQEGTGDPSPENVRPIAGWNSLQMTRCGKNLLDFGIKDISQTTNGVTVNYNATTQVITMSGTSESQGNTIVFQIPVTSLSFTSGQKYTITSNTPTDAYTQFTYYTNEGALKALAYNTSSGAITFVIPDDFRQMKHFQIGVEPSFNLTVPVEVSFQLELGSTPTDYEPYQGDTYDMALPEKVYGGTVDCVTGEGEKTWETIVIDEDFIANNVFADYGSDQGKPGFYILRALNGAYNRINGLCSHAVVASNSNPYPDANSFIWLGVNNNNFIYWLDAFAAFGVSSLDDAKNALIAQATAGTPVTIAYQLAAPEPFEVSPQPVLALDGVNTLYTDGDSVTVSGKSYSFAFLQKVNSLKME